VNQPQPFFASHDRHWRDFLYVYPVISRRARGLSIGINLNPDAVCNFDCIYCQVDRSVRRPRQKINLGVLEQELRTLVGGYRHLFDEPDFSQVPPEYRRLNDIAFSGDGEPTASPAFPEAVHLAAAVRRDCGADEAKIVVITDACFLSRPKVAAALAFLDQHNGEIWAKLDAGTEDYFRRINRPSHTLQHVLENILVAARIRPIVIQSLFMRTQGEPPRAAEIEAYVGRLRLILEQGGRLALVQIYTVARRPAEDYVSVLSADELEQIARQVRSLGVHAECYA
jgi:wyosine [tRNA(Phe)-imidazoG37] synthetase (radical SAM superfamily)